MSKGVYQIRNTVNGERYIGGTRVAFAPGWSARRMALAAGDHHCLDLQADWDRYRADVFLFEILEETPAADVHTREQYWMDHFSHMGTLRSCPKAGSPRDRPLTDKELQSLARARQARWSKPGAAERMAEQMRQRWADPEQRAKNLAAIRATSVSDDQKVAHAESARAQWADPEQPKRIAGMAAADQTPERKQRRSDATRRAWKNPERKQKTVDALSKTYTGFVSPDGIVYAPVTNLQAFCRDHELDRSGMYYVSIGKYQSHKGWTRYEPKEELP